MDSLALCAIKNPNFEPTRRDGGGLCARAFNSIRRALRDRLVPARPGTTKYKYTLSLRRCVDVKTRQLTNAP